MPSLQEHLREDTPGTAPAVSREPRTCPHPREGRGLACLSTTFWVVAWVSLRAGWGQARDTSQPPGRCAQSTTGVLASPTPGGRLQGLTGKRKRRKPSRGNGAQGHAHAHSHSTTCVLTNSHSRAHSASRPRLGSSLWLPGLHLLFRALGRLTLWPLALLCVNFLVTKVVPFSDKCPGILGASEGLPQYGG